MIEAALLAAGCAGVSYYLFRRRLHEQTLEAEARTKREAAALLDSARTEAARKLEEARTLAEQAQKKRLQQSETELANKQAALKKTEEQLKTFDQTLKRSEQRLEERTQALRERERTLSLLGERKKAAEVARSTHYEDAVTRLQEIAGETHKEAQRRLIEAWLEQVRAEGADRLRQIEQSQADPEYVRDSRRMLDIAVQRYQGHYLTERLLSTLPIQPEIAELIGGSDGSGFELIGEVANVKLQLADDRTTVRLEGQDSFGREIARRALSRFARNMPRGGPDHVRKAVQSIADELERETVELGRRAFKELEIPRAHPDIVRLVGRLNYRTSYSQNQWKHAVEVAFLCGMLASELKLDLKIARRAALMHDIGKSLTHAIDGSHAVIGADYARRLGESEIVANAIGAHHLDEPFSSPYAYIVAAADALSGARPGARHEQEGSYGQRLEELERIASSMPGVDRVYALQAGREVRVHVKEAQIDDARAAALSTELANQISENMVFPGQIRVTVIREFTAVTNAN